VFLLRTWGWPIPHARGVDIFRRIPHYPTKPNGKPVKSVVELLVDHSVADIADYVLEVRSMRGAEVLGSIWASS